MPTHLELCNKAKEIAEAMLLALPESAEVKEVSLEWNETWNDGTLCYILPKIKITCK